MQGLFVRKSVADCENDIAERGGLRRSLTKWHLTALGVGATIGAGIFATTGTAIVGDAVRPGAGPAIILSFVLTAVACGFAALCYAEFAAMVPIAGSAYTYAYASLGEFIAWIIGWDLIIEYAVGNIGVAIGWSGHFRELLEFFGLHLPAWLATDFRSARMAADALAAAGGGADPGTLYLASAITNAPHLGGIPIIFNLPAFLAVALITVILIRGVKESADSNNVMVLLKVGLILFFIAVGAFLIKPGNWSDPATGGFMPNGWAGVSAGAAIIFFSYIGFDAVSTAAEEAKEPARDMPFGIIMSLVICTVLYIALSAVMTGIAPWKALGTAEPMLTALEFANGPAWVLNFSRFIIALGAVIAMFSVLLVFQLGQPRIFFSMARDGLLPPFIAKVHPKYKTPYVGTIITGLFVGTFAATANIAEVVDLTNIGTLFAFVLVSVGVIVLRYKEPERVRPFRVPWVPVTPLISVVACLYLMLQLPCLTWRRFSWWLLAGLVIYFLYGAFHSRMRNPNGPGKFKMPWLGLLGVAVAAAVLHYLVFSRASCG
ncbi:MAG: amino acid permease [Gemmatimonadetes bacterium]|nr:amino acid permease [Gemmatimonadota bacterium]MBK6779590.1 amino acid permease [Gemmatimonadota bacterium]MBK7716169.1 amino acid permease [Gemmatimonadota bacterium]MBK7923664.1 amino acid permease [Gemmatimonadota bacterium]